MADQPKGVVLHGDDGRVYKISHDQLQKYKLDQSDPTHAEVKKKVSEQGPQEDVCIFGAFGSADNTIVDLGWARKRAKTD